jgi:serine/threonine protein phosphatase PrpC
MMMRPPFDVRKSVLGLLRTLVLALAWVLVGVLLWWLPGRFPPPAWIILWQLLHARGAAPPLLWLPVLGQTAALVLAWLGWMGLAIRWLGHRVATPFAAPSRGEAGAASGSGEVLPDPRTSVWISPADHEAQNGGASPCWMASISRGRLPRARARVQLRSLLTASSTGREAARPFSTRLGDALSEGDGEPDEHGCLLAIGGWCQAGLSPGEASAEDALLIATFQADLSDRAHAVPLVLLALADGRQVAPDAPTASPARLALALLCETLLPKLSVLAGLDAPQLAASLQEVVAEAGARLDAAGAESPAEEMSGTALVAALLLDRSAYLLNLGHGRAYLYREQEGLAQITTDHAVLPTVTDKEGSAPGVAPPACLRGLYRSLEREAAHADHVVVPLGPFDLLLLCTDGCARALSPDHFADLVEGCARRLPADPFRLAAVLHEQVLERSGVDAASLITVAVLPAEAVTHETAHLAGGRRRRSGRPAGQRRRRTEQKSRKEGAPV